MVLLLIIFTVVLLIFELLTQSVWALCLSIGCVGGIITALLGVPIVWESVIVGLVSMIALCFIMPQIKIWLRRHADAKGGEARTGMDALLGRRCIVTQEIKPGMMGRVQIDGDSWQAVTNMSDTIIRRGAEAIVIAYNSIIITVTPYNS